MKAKILLRIAAVVILVHLLGHTGGHLTWDTPEDARMGAVVTTMKSYKANFMGATKSMADYFNGYSYIMFGLYIMSIALLLVISGFVEEQKGIANQLLYPMGLVYLAFGIIEYIFFFPFAASISFIAGLLIILAATARR